jgi:5-methylcytosine-specific restriction enzyme subunit McrC
VKIPIRNLYYLFLYAWARFPDGPMAEAGIDKSPDLPNLFAKLLSAGTRRVLRRGLDRGYKTFTEELASPKGRLCLDRMIKEATQLRGTAVCDFDELTHDILHNQVLKATLTNLGSCPDVEKATGRDLRSLARRFHDVADIQLSAHCFRRVVISRNNREYNFLMRLCEFVFWSLMPDERGATSWFQKVLDDAVRMSAVFEDFLRNFFELNRAEYRVRAEAPEWYVTDATEGDLVFLPRMLTDITLRHANHTIIVDAKFYPTPLVQSYHGGGERVRSQHLYQLITYLQHERLRHEDKGLAGMLIYPDVGRSLRLRYQLLGIPILIATVDLGKEWHDIEIELHKLLDACATAAVLTIKPDVMHRVPIRSSLRLAMQDGGSFGSGRIDSGDSTGAF